MATLAKVMWWPLGNACFIERTKDVRLWDKNKAGTYKTALKNIQVVNSEEMWEVKSETQSWARYIGLC